MATEPVTIEGNGLGGRFILPDGARHTYLANRGPGTAFSGWDNRDHWLEYTVDVPADGAYTLTLRVCMTEPAERALLVDGAYPDDVFRTFNLTPTGGFSNGSDDWDNRDLPKLLRLRKGRHVLRFINVSKPTNLDWISLHAPGEPPRE
ncbi:MAG: hypothetical protein A3K19_05715 [Lentisphaerae bacterium RIFOXYB12_FULL_65_16]|nr:MAG: hypothetical protein A3K18_23755 [Lentisphaerae bacterium RIFOXYA12_64_32]OGV94407.1 MAG: hypothetical protein A3K19_05715 [Lentisphaerae bacterium RIFOXYB12_FULL_65_16]